MKIQVIPITGGFKMTISEKTKNAINVSFNPDFYENKEKAKCLIKKMSAVPTFGFIEAIQEFRGLALSKENIIDTLNGMEVTDDFFSEMVSLREHYLDLVIFKWCPSFDTLILTLMECGDLPVEPLPPYYQTSTLERVKAVNIEYMEEQFKKNKEWEERQREEEAEVEEAEVEEVEVEEAEVEARQEAEVEEIEVKTHQKAEKYLKDELDF